jgi:DNA-directed RNA polymerase subunit RPC12/RpoP
VTDAAKATPPQPVEEGARYSHFEAVLDCAECGDEIRIEGDVSNGEAITCDACGSALRVYGR